MNAPEHLDIEDNIGTLRVPPHSNEAEQSVLGGLLLDNDAMDRIGWLGEGEFYDRGHRVIYGAIRAMVAAQQSADVITVYQRLDEQSAAADIGGLVYLNALAQSVPSSANIRRYAEIVREKAQQRTLIAAADEAAGIAWDSTPIAAKVDHITSLFGALQRQQVRKMPRAIADIALERTAHYDELAAGTVQPGWRTHIAELTSRLSGGMRPGSLYILAARPSVGKSSFAEDLGINFAIDGLPTLFLSQEMADTEVADRGVSNMGRVSYRALLTGDMGKDGWSRAVDAMEAMAKLPFFIDDQPALTLQDIRFKAKSCKGLKVLILDYLQLCSSSRRDGNRNGEIEEISRGLKALAKELGIAVIALSQLNRDVEKRANKRPTLSDLRDSGAIEQDADVVIFLWPVREFEDEGRRIVGCGIDKNRQGRLGEFGLDFFGDTQRWMQSEADIRPDTQAKRKTFE
jgi:replicative DNA helicase